MAPRYASALFRRRLKRRPSYVISLFLLTLITTIICIRYDVLMGRPALKQQQEKEFAERKLLRAASHNGAVVLTTSNYMYREHLRNLQCGMRRLSLPYTPVVYAQDAETDGFAIQSNLTSIPLSLMRADDVNPGSFEEEGARSFGHITRQKLTAVARALGSGLDVLITDADIHWCGDALAAVREEAPDADMLVMAEAGFNTLNSGFYYVRGNIRTREAFNIMALLKGYGNHDQDVFNAVLCNSWFGARRIEIPHAPPGTAPFRCISSTGADVHVLDASRYPSGMQLYDGAPLFSYPRETLTRWCENKRFVVVHNNFIKAKKKRARMVVKGMWFVDKDDDMRCVNDPVPSTKRSERTCGVFCTERQLDHIHIKGVNDKASSVSGAAAADSNEDRVANNVASGDVDAAVRDAEQKRIEESGFSENRESLESRTKRESEAEVNENMTTVEEREMRREHESEYRRNEDNSKERRKLTTHNKNYPRYNVGKFRSSESLESRTRRESEDEVNENMTTVDEREMRRDHESENRRNEDNIEERRKLTSDSEKDARYNVGKFRSGETYQDEKRYVTDEDSGSDQKQHKEQHGYVRSNDTEENEQDKGPKLADTSKRRSDESDDEPTNNEIDSNSASAADNTPHVHTAHDIGMGSHNEITTDREPTAANTNIVYSEYSMKSTSVPESSDDQTKEDGSGAYRPSQLEISNLHDPASQDSTVHTKLKPPLDVQRSIDINDSGDQDVTVAREGPITTEVNKHNAGISNGHDNEYDRKSSDKSSSDSLRRPRYYSFNVESRPSLAQSDHDPKRNLSRSVFIQDKVVMETHTIGSETDATVASSSELSTKKDEATVPYNSYQENKQGDGRSDYHSSGFMQTKTEDEKENLKAQHFDERNQRVEVYGNERHSFKSKIHDPDANKKIYPERSQSTFNSHGSSALQKLKLPLDVQRTIQRDRASAPPTAQDTNTVTSVLLHASYQGTVLVATSNYMYRQFMRNLQCSLRRLELPYKPVVFALDKRMHEFAQLIGLDSIVISNEIGDDVAHGKFEKKGVRSFNHITRQKLLAVSQGLRAGVDVLMTDGDIHWCNDAMAALKREIGDADMLIMAEAGYKTLNSGFYYVRSNERTRKLFDVMVANANVGKHDQDVVNAVLCEKRFGAKRVPVQGKPVPYECVTAQGATVRVLDAQKYPSGAEIIDGIPVFDHSRDRLHRMCRRQRFVVLHNNFVRAEKKMNRMVNKGMWFVEDSKHMKCLTTASRKIYYGR